MKERRKHAEERGLARAPPANGGNTTTLTRGRGVPSMLWRMVCKNSRPTVPVREALPAPLRPRREKDAERAVACRQRAGVSEMPHALNSLYGVEDYAAAQRTSPAQDEACRMLPSRVPPQETLRALLRSSAVYGDGSSTAPEFLALPDSGVQATPVQEIVRREDSEYLVGFKEKILLSSEEFRETVGSEGPARVHVDPALKRASVYKRFIWRLVSLGMVSTIFGFGG